MMSGTLELSELRRAAQEIFAEALRGVDAGAAVRRAVKLDDGQLSILNTVYNLEGSALASVRHRSGQGCASDGRSIE